jgi:hypothetical protein
MDNLETLPPQRQLTPEEEARVVHLFTYHAPTPDQQYRYIRIRATAQVLAAVLLTEVPQGADQSAAMRLLRECVMTANAGVALNGKT